MDQDEKTMLYVAADPKQPGAAWAATVDEPKYAKDTADTLADWVMRGAIVQRVDRVTAMEMLRKWVRPTIAQKELL